MKLLGHCSEWGGERQTFCLQPQTLYFYFYFLFYLFIYLFFRPYIFKGEKWQQTNDYMNEYIISAVIGWGRRVKEVRRVYHIRLQVSFTSFFPLTPRRCCAWLWGGGRGNLMRVLAFPPPLSQGPCDHGAWRCLGTTALSAFSWDSAVGGGVREGATILEVSQVKQAGGKWWRILHAYKGSIVGS
jgi:hypothetical protein